MRLLARHRPDPMLRVLLVLLTTSFFMRYALVAGPAENESARVLTPEIAAWILGTAVEPAARNSQADIRNGQTVVSQCSYSVNDGALALRSDSLIFVSLDHDKSLDKLRQLSPKWLG